MTTIHPLPFYLFFQCHMNMGRPPTVLLFLVLLPFFVNVANGIMCRSCEGDMCTYNAMTINCQFPVRACMRIYSSQTGRTYKAGCLYPFENCDRAQFTSGDQMRCSSCTFDNCNSIPSPYGGMDPQQQDRYGPPYGPGGGGQGPPYYPGPGDGRYNRPPYGPDGRYGYFWNEAFSARGSTLRLFLIFPFLLGILSFFIFVRN